MGKLFDRLNDNLTRFILDQPVFFVATAPSGSGGHVNLSPKGLAGSLSVIDSSTVAYLDLIGSGVETIAHLRDNGRITLMFNAFEGPPMILRLFGRGEAVLAGDPGFAELRPRFTTDPQAAVRSVIVVHVDEARTSCGYGVPLMDYVGDRDNFQRWTERHSDDDIVEYWQENNMTSLDGLPGLPHLPALPSTSPTPATS